MFSAKEQPNVESNPTHKLEAATKDRLIGYNNESVKIRNGWNKGGGGVKGTGRR